MKIRKREKMSPIHLAENDTISLLYEEKGKRTKEVLRDEVGRDMVVNEAVIFDIEKEDFEGAVDGIGGAVLTSKDL